MRLFKHFFSFPVPLAFSFSTGFRKHDHSVPQIDLSKSICWSGGALRPLTSQTLSVELHALQPLPHFQPSKILWMNVWRKKKKNKIPPRVAKLFTLENRFNLIDVKAFFLCFLFNNWKVVSVEKLLRYKRNKTLEEDNQQHGILRSVLFLLYLNMSFRQVENTQTPCIPDHVHQRRFESSTVEAQGNCTNQWATIPL